MLRLSSSLARRAVPVRAAALPAALTSQRCFSEAAMQTSAPGESEDAMEFRETVRAFAQQVIAPHAASIDANNTFPKDVDLWKAMGDMGLHGERDWGGQGVHLLIKIEQMCGMKSGSAVERSGLHW